MPIEYEKRGIRGKYLAAIKSLSRFGHIEKRSSTDRVRPPYNLRCTWSYVTSHSCIYSIFFEHDFCFQPNDNVIRHNNIRGNFELAVLITRYGVHTYIHKCAIYVSNFANTHTREGDTLTHSLPVCSYYLLSSSLHHPAHPRHNGL